MRFIEKIKDCHAPDVKISGGKGASLSKMSKEGLLVPDGFIIFTTVFKKFLEVADLGIEIDNSLRSVDQDRMYTIECASKKIRSLIIDTEIPIDMEELIRKSFKTLKSKHVAVRSSATAEDSATAAWAGQLESYLNVTEENLLESIKNCWASLFTQRAIFYRFKKVLHHQKIYVAVVVQEMIQSEKSGVAFSVHPVTQNKDQLIIEAGFGLGEAIVSGQITPDSYIVDKVCYKIINKNISRQSKGLYLSKNGHNEWREINKRQGCGQKLSDVEIIELSRMIVRIEKSFDFPVDIEWTIKGNKIFILQSRPITTLV